MSERRQIQTDEFSWKDSALYTPGPLTTSRTVKQAMLRDVGSRDAEFIGITRDICDELLRLAGVPGDDFTAVLMQGSGTFGLESVIGSVIPPSGKLLVAINGAYGRRMARIAEVLRIPLTTLEWPENEIVESKRIDAALAGDPAITHMAVVHCETTSGLLNPLSEIGRAVKKHKRFLIVDAMSSFGALPIDFAADGVDYLVSSANKCLEGVPGFSFIIARVDALRATKGWARSLSLDLFAQFERFATDGQFRFTPPTHALLAFRQALRELAAEGGIMARQQRYERNRQIIADGMRRLGFRPYLRPAWQSSIITSFHYPRVSAFDFREFYTRLGRLGFVIYPGKVGDADCFRIGHIGRLDERDMFALLAAIERVLAEMGIKTPIVEEDGGISRRRVLFLCTGNSCRSQMAEGYLRHLAGERFWVASAGLEPQNVHPLAVRVMAEDGVDISSQRSKSVKEYLGRTRFDTVIIVCDHAQQNCPAFWPGTTERIFWPFPDPAAATGSEEEKIAKFREIRDAIKTKIKEWIS